MFFRLTSSWDPVQLADTAAELEAIAAFRSKHDLPATVQGFGVSQVFIGPLDGIQAVASLRVFEGRNAPDELRNRYALDLFPNLENLRFCEIGRFSFAPSVASRVLPSMARGVYDLMAGTFKCDIALSLARPDAVNHHRKLGARPYGAAPVHDQGALSVPLASVLSDGHYLRTVGAITAPQVAKHFGEGKRAPLDLAPMAHLFERDEALIETASERVWDEVRTALADAGTPSLADAMPEAALKRMAENGLILEVPAGGTITEQGDEDTALLMILRGRFEVEKDQQVIAHVGRGDVVGEVAFFLQQAHRSATIRATEPGRVVLLRQNFLQELNRQDPDAAFVILMNLGRIVSQRLIGS